MGDRQRNYAQYATALNQYANFNSDGERSSRERGDGGPGSGPGGSNNGGAGSSSSSGGASHGGTASAGNAALWGELSRTLQYNNYPGFGTAWQGGGGDMRLYGYGGYGDGQVDGRGEGRTEGRSEGRRVPSKGETKATPPLPPGMGASMGSALASLQQLVASGGPDAANVYRSFLAARQYAAAAAALSALPTAPPPPISPAALHAATALSGHHQQQQQQQQQQRRQQQQQQQQQHHQQQLQQQQAAAFVAAATAGLNGEGLGMHGASRMQQPSPQGRKCTPVPADLRHDDPLPSPGRTRSHPPPTINNQETICTPVIGKGSFEPPPGVGDGGGDMGSDGRRVQSGSESEGDQRIRHRRKQEQPRRQSVIYPVAMQSESGGGGDSSSDDSQGYDLLLSRNASEHRDSPHDSVHSNSPVDPALRLSREAFPGQGMSQAMSHALAHPFLAAHLNASQLLQVAQTTPPPTKQDVPPAPSPHSQTHQLQVRTDLLEPHPKEPEVSYPPPEPLPRSLSQPQISLPELDIRSVRTPPSNASLDSNVAPVKKRRCSPSYMENDTVVSDSMVGKTTSNASEVMISRSEVGGGNNSLSSSSYNQTRDESTAHNISSNVESTPVNGLGGSCEPVDKNASCSGSDSQSSLNVSMQSCETDKELNRSVDKSDQDFYNGDNEMVYSPRKRNRKRKSESEPAVEAETPSVEGQLDESAESKRRTRQKRAISYVEDGTDPVLEMNEDSSPDATPVKKKGRKPKEVRDRTDSESNLSPEQPQPQEPPPTSPPVLPPPPPPPPPQPSSGPQEESPPKSMHNSPPGRGRGRGSYRGAPRGRGRLQMTTNTHEFSNITEPLHVDTSLAIEPDLRVPGPPPITPSSCSPDVYDFNDTDSDGVGRGKKGKRGRKKGFSPKKNNKQSPMEAVKASISPRSRETLVKSPKSPKFFSSSRSPVSERNKEWLRGVSPPVRDLSKALSEVTCYEGGTTYNHSPAVIDGKSSDVLQNSESCDSLANDNAKLDVNVTSPRRSTRRAKTREVDSSMLDVRDDSSDVSLQSIPSNSKMNTTFSGSILNNAQNCEEKTEKAEDPLSCGSDIADGSPSSRVRRRGRRPLDHGDMMASQVYNNDVDNLSSPEKCLPTCVDSTVTDDEHTKVPDSINVDEKCNSVPPVKKSKRGRPPKGLKVESPGVAAKGKGKGRGKKRKRKFTPFPKGTKKKMNELPNETSQYQTVPEDVYEDAGDPAVNSTREANSCAVENTSFEKTEELPVANDIKSEGSLPQNKPNKLLDATSSPCDEKSSNSCEASQSETVLKTSDTQESSGETLTVIAQVEETESRGVRRLRGRRASSKQDGKVESELSKPKEEELNANEIIKKSSQGPDVEEIPHKKSLTQESNVEIKESVSDTQDSKETVGSSSTKAPVEVKSVSPNKHSDTPNAISGIQDKSKVHGLTMPYPKRKGLESFDSQFKAFVESDKSSETQEFSNSNDFPEIKGKQDVKDDHGSFSGTGRDAAKASTPSAEPETKCFSDRATAENQTPAAKQSGIQKSVAKQDKGEDVKPHCHQLDKSENESKGTFEVISVEPNTKVESEEKPIPPDTASKNGEKKRDVEHPPPESLGDSSSQQPVVKEAEVSNKNSAPGVQPDVPEASTNTPLPPPDALEVPQGTDMDVDAETVENIAKFLEETAVIPGATEETYSEKRPKRSSRPPRNMDDNEMNDLLMLLNMEDEESEDEDYVPKDLENLDSAVESDDGADSDGNDDDYDSSADYESEGRGGSTLSNFLEFPGDTGGDNDKMPSGSFKQGKGSAVKSKGLKNGKGKKYKSDTSSAKKGKVKGKVKYNNKGRSEDDTKRKGDDGKKKGDGEKKGPYVRVDPSTSGEVIVNTPYRDEEEQDKQVRKLNIQFYCKIEAKQKTAKVGYNSTLHNNYDAFSKDTTWFCSLCKNYSHTWKLGDLFGPYFIEGLTVCKKKYPKVIEGQVVESTSPNEVGRFKKRPPRRESTSDVPGESKKLELGGCSPPWRFVPAATPARMLCRPGSKDGGGGGVPPPIQDASNPVSTSNTKEGSTGDPITPVTAPAEARPPGTECWVHELCLLWSPGVHIINSKLCGLEDAVIHAQDSVCSNCSEAGATIGCLGKGCSLMVHVPCATQLHWTLDRQTFMSFCPKHSVSSPKDQSEVSSVP